mgnify:FL=1
MDKLFRWVLLASIFAVLSSSAFGQEVSPMIVEGPRYSKTAFNNWEKIELTYAVRYMKGYEPLIDDMKPGNMMFGVLELDPEFAEKVDIRNPRIFGNEYYFDITYHLRYISEKKEELEIPGQKFPYIRIQAGKEKTELMVEFFSTSKFYLSYQPVTTSDADDIKDNIDFGSFSKQALLWKVSGGAVFFGGILLTLIAVFSKPVLVVQMGGKSVKSTESVETEAVDPHLVSRALVEGTAKVKILLKSVDSVGLKTELGAVCNNARILFRIYAPDINPGAVYDEMTLAIQGLEPVWERERLTRLISSLKYFENFLYKPDVIDTELPTLTLYVNELYTTATDLDPRIVSRQQLLFRWKRRLTGWWLWKS